MRRVLKRRSFLRRCWQAAGAVFTPAASSLAQPNAPTAPSFHLQPKYREHTAIDDALLYVRPGSDGFVTEQYFVKVAAVLDKWRAGLLESPHNVEAVGESLSATFRGTSWQPASSILTRPIGSGIEIRRNSFAAFMETSSTDFISGMRSASSHFSKLLTVEFQVTDIRADGNSIITRIRYELIGSGAGMHREQRIGDWLLKWQADKMKIVTWQAWEEEVSRSSEASFKDVTQWAFGDNSSYSWQLLRGADHWRTVLDGATGIDIYGHNGVSVGDVYGTGHDDVYVCQPAGLPNRLFRNRGDGSFEDITELAGVGVIDNTACALFADFNNNGREDLLVVRANGPLLFQNEGNGKFQLKPDAFRFAKPPQGTFTGAAAADYNRNGQLDVYFCLYSFYQGTGQYKYPTPYFAAEDGPPNFLMRNNGDNTFSDVTREAGLDKNNTRYSFCCGWGDYNQDGWPDLYVVNDFGKKNLYKNNGDGTFTDVAPEAGAEDVGAGMSVCWLDYATNQSQSLYIANMWTAAGSRLTNDADFQRLASTEARAFYRKHAMGNSMLRNEQSRFRDVTGQSHTGNGRWSWSSDTWDFDHDGRPDLYIANGMVSGPISDDLNSYFWRQVVARSPNSARADTEYENGWNGINDLLRSDYSWSGYERNVAFANNGDGTFSNVSGALGLDFMEDGRAFALADFDGDGRQEVLVKNRNAPQLRLIKNTLANLPASISFRLQGTKSNRNAIGALITIQTSNGRQTKMLQAGSGFLSQHSKDLFFGLGPAPSEISATIHWPSGLIQQVNELTGNQRVWITEGSTTLRREPFKTSRVTPSVAIAKAEKIPDVTESWLLAPVLAPMLAAQGKIALLTFAASARAEPQVEGPVNFVNVSVEDKQNDDLCAVYNLLFRYLFDRHVDLPLPSSFLIDEHRQIVKVYRGPVDRSRVEQDALKIPRNDQERLAKALPFPGDTSSFAFGRNYLSLGSIFFQRGYFDPSSDFFSAALKNDPQSAEAFYGLGSVYLKQNKNREASECFESAIRFKPSYPETTPNAWNNLGLIATREGDTTKAVQQFEQALRVDPDHFVALENLGNAYRQQKHWEQARTTLERALVLRPEDAEANYSLGMVFAQLDDNATAYDYLKKALETRPDYPEALNNLGVLYLRTRHRDDAVASFQRCIKVAPDFDQSYLNLARVYVIEGDTGKARKVLQTLLALRPDNAAAKQAIDQLP